MSDKMTIEDIVTDRADWLVDAIAMATQNPAFLRLHEKEDTVATEAIFLNAKLAIRAAITAAMETK